MKIYRPRIPNELKTVNLLPIIGLMSKTNRFKYFLGSVLFIALSVGFIKSTFDVLKSKDRLDEISREVVELEAKKAEIEKEIEYKQTSEYIEERARNDLNLIKPGEKVYVVVGQEGLRQDSNVL